MTMRHRRRKATLAIALALAAAAVVATAVGTSGAQRRAYRTMRAHMASVETLLHLPATVDPTNKVTLTFGVSGTVAAVAVTVGQQVGPGETLATLVPTGFVQKVSEAQANLVAAEAAVAADLLAQRVHVAPAGSSPVAGGHPTNVASPTSAGAEANSAAVASAQQALEQAQQAADAAQKTAEADVRVAASACGGTGSTTPPTAPATGVNSLTGRVMKPAPLAATPATPAACRAALSAALAAEQALATAQHALAQAESALARLLATPSRATPPAGVPPSGGGGAPGTGTSTSTVPATPQAQAAQLASDQSTVDADRASLIQAQQSLAAARLTSPVGGTVAAVRVVPGQAVTSGTTTQAVTVVDRGSFAAVASLRASVVPRVALGDSVSVSVDGLRGAVWGTVTRIGPVDTAGGDTYPMVVALPPGTRGLFAGSIAQLGVVARRARDVLVVPTSAVHTGSGGSYVVCLRGDGTVRVRVLVGVAGDVYTQIRSGLHLGETVVLAVLTRPVPKTSGSSTLRLGGAPVRVVHGGT